MLKEIKSNVESGQTFAEALKKYPKYFDDLFINMISAGEAGGILDTILRRLSAYMEKAAKLKAQIKGAMVYPIVTMIIAAVVVGVINLISTGPCPRRGIHPGNPASPVTGAIPDGVHYGDGDLPLSGKHSQATL